MPKGEFPSPFSPEQSQQLETILSALQTLSVAVAALPGASLHIGDLETGQGADLRVTPDKGLTIEYKAPKEELVYPVKEIEPVEGITGQSNTSTSSESAKQNETEGRVTLTGRLAYEPNFKKTKTGLLRGTMALAVPDETTEKKVRYEQIYTTGKYAQKVMEADLHKGSSVQVVGYEQYRQSRAKDGSEKSVKQIYAVAVKPLGKK